MQLLKSNQSAVCLLLCLCFGAAFAESIEDYYEYQQPLLVEDYWPVFGKDPRSLRNGEFPVIDVVIGTDGTPIAAAPVGTVAEEERDVLSLTGTLLRFTPAYACGEKVEGFARHWIQAYFVVDEQDLDKITGLPVARFIIPEEIQRSLNYITTTIRSTAIIYPSDLEFAATLIADGMVSNLEAKSSEGEVDWAKVIADTVLKPMLPAMKFQPATKDDQPVDVRIKFFLRIGETPDGAGLFDVGARKPLPRKPATVPIETGKIHSVLLTFNQKGILQTIQFLSLMSREESLAALNAFRNWTLEPSEADGSLMQNLVVAYAYTDDSERADLIEERLDTGLVPPEPIKQPMPKTPSHLKKLDQEGIAAVVFIVDRKGKVRCPVVEFATHPDFGESAIKAVKNWKLEPGQMNGQPVACRIRHVFRFNHRK